MEVRGDELAGVVDLFGGLTRAELSEALAELAYKHGETYDPAAFTEQIEDAIRTYQLLALDPATVGCEIDQELLVAGPVAFPSLPTDARDLLHILDIEKRSIDHETVREAGIRRFRADAAQALDAGDESRMRILIDVSYELETWASVELADVRDRLE